MSDATPSTRSPAPPRRSRLRTRLAIGMSLTALGVAALVAISAAALSSWRSGDAGLETQAGAARVGDGVAVVVVAEGAEAADAARADALRWTLVALGVALVPAAVIGWFTSGRLLGRVDRALADIERTEAERTRQLHEVAHELRTPLTVMAVNLELAANGAAGDEELGGWIEAARNASERMRRTVGDLAGNGALAAGTSTGPVDLAAEAASLVSEHAGPARQRRVQLRTAGGGPVWVPTADRQSVHTTLGNLLDNAVGLSLPGSTVTVGWGRLDDWAWISVADEGPGLAPRRHARVFERGWSGRPDRDRNGPPRGLGLTIARQLVEANHGALTVESSEGEGSVFTVWLPLTAAANRSDVVDRDGIHPRTSPWRPLDRAVLTPG
jgi:signal transduction histidine kinase